MLQQLSKDLQVYQLLEQELTQKKARTLYKIPEIDKSLKAVELLLQRRDEDESVGTLWHVMALLCRMMSWGSNLCDRRPLISALLRASLPKPASRKSSL